MRKKKLGRSDTEISEIGLGTWQYRGGVEPLRLGVHLGATMIDTAEIYGTEDIVGKSIEGIRDQVFIATKVSADHLHYQDVLKAADASLRRLKIKTIDLYQVHWPNPEIPIKEAMSAMESLVKQGKIRYIGVSNFSVQEMKEAQEALSSQEIVSNQVRYSLSHREIESELLPYCAKEKITVIAYSPLARGGIAGRGSRNAKILDDVGTKHGKTRSQVALNWLNTHEPVVSIPKSDKLDHVRDNCGASGWTLAEEDIERISDAFE